jgi:hypothetical protein
MNSSYQVEQLEALCLVRMHLNPCRAPSAIGCGRRSPTTWPFGAAWMTSCTANFGGVCSTTCYRSRLSACCSREGDCDLFRRRGHQPAALRASARPTSSSGASGRKHRPEVRLPRAGRLPVARQTDRVPDVPVRSGQGESFRRSPRTASEWADFEQERKLFTWPDRPVLFDLLEAYFISAGCSSSLMYLHQSPGLLRVKRQAGLY